MAKKSTPPRAQRTWAMTHQRHIPGMIKHLRETYGGPKDFLAEEDLLVFLCVLPEHAHLSDHKFQNYWLALAELSSNGRVDMGALAKLFVRMALIESDDWRTRVAAIRRHDKTGARAVKLIRELRALLVEYNEHELRGLRGDEGQLERWTVKQADDALSHFDRAVTDVQQHLLRRTGIDVIDMDEMVFKTMDPDFTYPRHTGRGTWPKPWTEKDAPRLLRRLHVPARLIDDLLYPFRTPRRRRRE